MNKYEDLLKKINEKSTYREIKDELLTIVDKDDDINDLKMKCEGYSNTSIIEILLSMNGIILTAFFGFVTYILSFKLNETMTFIILIIVAVALCYSIIVITKEVNEYIHNKIIISNILHVINTIENNPEIICDKCKCLYYCPNGLRSLTQKRKCKCNNECCVKKY